MTTNSFNIQKQMLLDDITANIFDLPASVRNEYALRVRTANSRELQQIENELTGQTYQPKQRQPQTDLM